jgi:hypothetical protein
MCTKKRLDLSDPRYWYQNARMAIRDVYDAIVELVTNADDAYTRAGGRGGRIDIEIERRRKGAPSTIRVRDCATGMTPVEMDEKLARLGDRRHSGLADGARVRGTNSRGAKDVAALGTVTFEAIDPNGRYAKRQINTRGEFIGVGHFEPATGSVRRQLGISRGCGMLVTIELDPTSSIQIPQHEKMVKKLGCVVALRDILSGSEREVYLCDITQARRDRIEYRLPEAADRVKEQLKIPGYPGAEAKLVIKRARKPLGNGGSKFREGGILVKSRRAVHEATLFAPELEHDPHARRFFGYLRCPFIDDLWNQADERYERGLPPAESNPSLVLDPTRQGGLRRDHPFTKALFQEVLKRLRPLVEEERKREASQRAHIESAETRRRLAALEKAAAKFMQEHEEDSEEAGAPSTTRVEGGLRRRGFALSPPFCKLVLGHTQRYIFTVSQDTFPELAVGSTVQIICESDDIRSNKNVCPLELHPNRENVLRGVWEVRGERVTNASGVTARVGPVVATALVEVLATERDLYADVTDFRFQRKRYRVSAGRPKKIRLLAPFPTLVARPTSVRFNWEGGSLKITGDRTLKIRENLGIAECQVWALAYEPDAKVRLEAEIDGHKTETEVATGAPVGESIQIGIEDVQLGNQRSRWRGNILEIAARHPSVRRYLGPKSEGFPGQEKTQFRVLLAEIVAYAVSERILSRNVENNPDDYKDYDLEAFIAERNKLVTEFLPSAHESQVPDP